MSQNRAEIVETVRDVVAQHAHLSADAAELSAADSLYSAGMTSHASVNVMLGVEDAFDIEFPEELLTKDTFESLDSIVQAVATLQDDQ
ncbi:acyl carrier protein [Kocuria sp.]|uniref:acyl carrier protein n=1 Tax=Kocuria sp. TaxID=1871328 RepID=UPI0026DF127D|nr:acyl carrier protein [Kocuria sp.]MDO5619075.1 acyl carrier protein [Kocuria sp.]